MVDSSTRNQSAADGLDAIRCVLERAGVRAGVHQSNSFKPDESRESSALTPPLRFTICDLRFANVRCNNSASLAGILLGFFDVPQRGTGRQPKVGAQRLPWVEVENQDTTPTGLWPIPMDG